MADEKSQEKDDSPAEEEGSKHEGKKSKGKGRPKKEGGPKRKASKPTHPPTLDMVMEALETLADRKGSSVQAIKGYILAHFKTVRADMIKAMLRRALANGLKEGVITRPKGQLETQQVLMGRYVRKGKKDETGPPKPRPPSLRQPKREKVTKKGKKGKKKGRGRR